MKKSEMRKVMKYSKEKCPGCGKEFPIKDNTYCPTCNKWFDKNYIIGYWKGVSDAHYERNHAGW